MTKSFMSVIGALAMLGAVAAQGQLSAEQQKCVAVVNKDTAKVLATQNKLASSCVKVASATAEACIALDADGKVQTAIDKAVAHDAALCLDPPAFAYLTAGTAAAVAVQVSTDTVRDVVGNPIDGGLYPCLSNPGECRCQQKVINRVGKMLDSATRIFVKCKRVALLSATSAADIADCVTNAANALSIAADPKGALAKRRGLLNATLAKYCNGLQNDPFAGGQCPGASGPTGADCFKSRALCRACQLASGADGLGIDCDAWSGTTCS
jgi:hypothetical protein